MTPPERWYQLSMLQLLAAMLVLAVFVAKNMTVQHLGDEYFYVYAQRECGWPFTNWSAGG